VKDLFALTLCQHPPALAGTASHCLMLIGSVEPRQTIDALGDNILKDHGQNHADSLLVLSKLVKKHSAPLLPQLPRLVETVVRSLDPNVPNLRSNCLRAATSVIHNLVKQYPMASFHQLTQKLAFGTNESVVIYDLKLANKLHVIEEHQGAITAVAFNKAGNLLAAYSAEKGCVRVWNVVPGIFSLIMSAPKLIRSFDVAKPDKAPSNVAILESVRLRWDSEQNLKLRAAWFQKSITLSDRKFSK